MHDPAGRDERMDGMTATAGQDERDGQDEWEDGPGALGSGRQCDSDGGDVARTLLRVLPVPLILFILFILSR
jgi:hypothetical protein